MAGVFQTITKKAVLLPRRQRYALAHLLLELNESSTKPEDEIEAAWELEIKKRADRVRSGKVKGKSLSEVLKRLR
jgi:hypothetical protein